MLAIVLSLLAAACGGGDDRSIAKGRQLHFLAEPPKVAEKVIFTDGNDNRWVIRPKASNRQIAVVQLTIANFSTTVASLLLNESAALLGDRRSDRIEPINPFESASPTMATRGEPSSSMVSSSGERWSSRKTARSRAPSYSTSLRA